MMLVASVCSICAHPEREAIDTQLVSGRSYRDIGAEHGVTISSLSRHRRSHVSEALKAVAAERAVSGPRSALSRFESLYDEAAAILAALKADGNASKSLVAIQTLSGVITQIAKLTGELDERASVQVVNLQSSPDWHGIRSTIMDALAPFPEARQAVVAALTGQPAPRVIEAGP